MLPALLLLLVPLASAQTFHIGRCPKPAVQGNFSMEQFLGRWHQIQSLPILQEEGRCMAADFDRNADGDFGVTFSQILDNEVKTWEAAVCPGKEEPAKLGVRYHRYLPECPLWVLHTDYSSVALMYYCQDLYFFHMDYAWIMSRTRTLSLQTLKGAKEKFTEGGVDVTEMTAADQTGCKDN